MQWMRRHMKWRVVSSFLNCHSSLLCPNMFIKIARLITAIQSLRHFRRDYPTICSMHSTNTSVVSPRWMVMHLVPCLSIQMMSSDIKDASLTLSIEESQGLVDHYASLLTTRQEEVIAQHRCTISTTLQVGHRPSITVLRSLTNGTLIRHNTEHLRGKLLPCYRSQIILPIHWHIKAQGYQKDIRRIQWQEVKDFILMLDSFERLKVSVQKI